jgi:hypothetical protein
VNLRSRVVALTSAVALPLGGFACGGGQADQEDENIAPAASTGETIDTVAPTTDETEE